MSELYSGIYNFVGNPGSGIKTTRDIAEGRIVLTNSACPTSNRCAFFSPETSADLSESLKNVHVQSISKMAIEQNKIAKAAGFMNYESVFVPLHTVGNYDGVSLVDGAGQAVAYGDNDDQDATKTVGDTDRCYLATKGWSSSVAGLLKKGDVVTISGVVSVNPVNKVPTGKLRTFVINEDVNSDGTGNARLNISPPIITAGAYKTVTDEPADGAEITVVTGAANSKHRQALGFCKNAFTLVTRPLQVPKIGMKSKTIMGNKVSLAVTEWGKPETLEFNYRLDTLYGVTVNHAMLACRMSE